MFLECGGVKNSRLDASTGRMQCSLQRLSEWALADVGVCHCQVHSCWRTVTVSSLVL